MCAIVADSAGLATKFASRLLKGEMIGSLEVLGLVLSLFLSFALFVEFGQLHCARFTDQQLTLRILLLSFASARQ